MALKFNIRKCLILMNQGLSANSIEKHHHISKRVTCRVKKRKEEMEFDFDTIDEYSDEELGRLFSLRPLNWMIFISMLIMNMFIMSYLSPV